MEAGIEHFEDAFLSQIVLWAGSTVGEQLRPKLDAITKTSTMVPLLPLLPPAVPSEGRTE